MRIAAFIGLLLNVAGVTLAGWALGQDYRKHADQPMLPKVAAAKRWFLVKVLRQTRSVTIPGGKATGTVTFTGSGTGFATPAADAPVDHQIAYLRDQVLKLHNRISEQRSEITEEINTVRQSVTDAARDAHEAVASVRDMARDIATGTVKIQMLGLLLVGLGSAVAAVPVVLGWT